MKQSKLIHVSYYALLKDVRGLDSESIQTSAHTVRELYLILKEQFRFPLNENALKACVNDALKSWDTEIKNGDHVVFIPPVSGG